LWAASILKFFDFLRVPENRYGSRRAQSLQARFGQRVKRLREARGWSFTYLSVHSGLAKNTIVEVESGGTEPRLNMIAALAGSFGKTLSELLRGL